MWYPSWTEIKLRIHIMTIVLAYNHSWRKLAMWIDPWTDLDPDLDLLIDLYLDLLIDLYLDRLIDLYLDRLIDLYLDLLIDLYLDPGLDSWTDLWTDPSMSP